jgi:ribosomal protein S4
MSRVLKPRYKSLIKLRYNFWNNSKFLKFNKKKWRKIKHILLKPVYKKKDNLFFLKHARLRFFYKLRLHTRKIFYSLYGYYKKKQFNKIIRNFSSKGTLMKSKQLYFNNLVAGNQTFDNVLHTMRFFESKLLISLYRSGFFKTVNSATHFIKLGGVSVNGKLIKNPFYSLKINDIVSIDKKNIVVSNLQIKQRRQKYFFKKMLGIHNYKIKNILYSFKNFKYIFVYKPFFEDLDNRKTIEWDMVQYLVNLKRL